MVDQELLYLLQSVVKLYHQSPIALSTNFLSVCKIIFNASSVCYHYICTFNIVIALCNIKCKANVMLFVLFCFYRTNVTYPQIKSCNMKLSSLKSDMQGVRYDIPVCKYRSAMRLTLSELYMPLYTKRIAIMYAVAIALMLYIKNW